MHIRRKSVASSQSTSQVKFSESYGDGRKGSAANEVALEHAYHHSALDCTSPGCQEKFHVLTERIKALENHVSSLENEIRWLQYRENESDVIEEKNIHSDNESGVSLQKENICSGNPLPKCRTMGRPRKENLKPHRQSQAEYVAHMKEKHGEEEYNAKEAERKRRSRKRVWESLNDNEKEQCRAQQKIRAEKLRKKHRIDNASSQSERNEPHRANAASATILPHPPTPTIESNPPSPSGYVEVSLDMSSEVSSDITPQTGQRKTGQLKSARSTSAGGSSQASTSSEADVCEFGSPRTTLTTSEPDGNRLHSISSSRSNQQKRTPRKARLYSKQRLERECHAAEESELKSQTAYLSKLVGNGKAQASGMMEESTESRKPEKNGYFCKMCWKSFSPDDVCAFEGGESASEMTYICDLCDSLVDGLDDTYTSDFDDINVGSSVLVSSEECEQKCLYCGKIFHSQNSYIAHSQTHVSRFYEGQDISHLQCGRCGKKYKQKYGYLLHTTKYCCKICKKSFKYKHEHGAHFASRHKISSKDINDQNIPEIKKNQDDSTDYRGIPDVQCKVKQEDCMGDLSLYKQNHLFSQKACY